MFVEHQVHMAELLVTFGVLRRSNVQACQGSLAG